MIPLMMEKGYRPTGWLGMLLGTRLYFSFHPKAVETDEMFMKQVDLVARALGDRGKERRLQAPGPLSTFPYPPPPVPIPARMSPWNPRPYWPWVAAKRRRS